LVISSQPAAATNAQTPRLTLSSWLKSIPFILLHVACFAVFLPWVEATGTALALCAGFYFLRMFAITGAYHRYFSHRAYKTSRLFQFVLAWLGCSAMQKGPLWWAGHHRHHHLHSDQEEDLHSPIKDSLWWSHVGWIISDNYLHTEWKTIHDFAKYPELRWLDRNHWVPGLALAAICYLVGGLSGLVWGFFVSTILVYHASFCINSLCHLIGRVRYKTTDHSKNSLVLALITLGEGWHNNHHYYQSSANQGFFWWEIDITYYTLKVLSWCGLIWDLRKVPEHKLRAVEEQPSVLVEPKVEIVPVRPEIAPALPPPIYTPVVVKARQALSAAGHTASDALTHAASSARHAAQAASQALSHAAEAASQAAAAARQAAGNAATSATHALAHAAESAAHAAKQATQALSHAAETASKAAASASAAAMVAAPIAIATAEAVSRS
jgi:stearoyl-CoA desaturase (Delta-9 desaturase)